MGSSPQLRLLWGSEASRHETGFLFPAASEGAGVFLQTAIPGKPSGVRGVRTPACEGHFCRTASQHQGRGLGDSRGTWGRGMEQVSDPGNTSSGAISDEGTSYSAEGGEKGHGLPGPRLSLHGASVLFQNSAWPSPPLQRTPLLRVYPLLRWSMNCATTQSGSPGSQEEDGPVAYKPAHGSGVKRAPSTWRAAACRDRVGASPGTSASLV